jgi:transcriptional regulator with XRE-family HTH domain
VQARKINPTRSEGLDGNPKELKLAIVRSLIWASKRALQTIAADAKLSVSTVSNYAHGDTLNPHDNTTERILQALGYRQVIVRKELTILAEVKPEPHWPRDLQKRREKRRQKRRGYRKSVSRRQSK